MVRLKVRNRSFDSKEGEVVLEVALDDTSSLVGKLAEFELVQTPGETVVSDNYVKLELRFPDQRETSPPEYVPGSISGRRYGEDRSIKNFSIPVRFNSFEQLRGAFGGKIKLDYQDE